MSTAELCSAALPMMGTTMIPDENLGKADARDRSFRRAHQDLGQPADERGGADQHRRGLAERPVAIPLQRMLLARDVRPLAKHRTMRSHAVYQGQRVPDDQQHRHADRHASRQHVRWISMRGKEHRGNHQSHHRNGQQRNTQAGQRHAESLHLVPQPTRELRRAEHEEKIPEDRAGDRCLHQVHQARHEARGWR